MQKFTCAIFGFLTLLLIIQELIPQVESARVRVARVRKGRHDKRQTQQQLLGFTDIPLDSQYDSRRPRQQRPEDNPYNAGNRNVDYPTRNPNQDDDRYNRQAPQQGGPRKPQKNSGEDDCEGCDGNGIPGEAGVDYPIYSALPKTGFDCKKQEWPGYYADTDAKCQVFWICQKNKGDAFLCPNGTLFNQQVYVCDWWYNVDCSAAPDFYSRNQYIYAGPGIDLFGNQVTVKQSVSVSGGDTRRPVAVASVGTSTSGSSVKNSYASSGNGNGGQSTREILQAIESGAPGTGGNAYRREISQRGDTDRSYSTPSITGSGRTNSDINYQTTTYSSREAATNVPFDTIFVREKPTATTKRYSNEELNYGTRKNDNVYVPQAKAAVILGPTPSKSSVPRENQIQNPFVKQHAQPRAPESPPSRSTSASGPPAPLRQPQSHFAPPASQQQQYTSTSPAKYYTPPPPLQERKYNNNAVTVNKNYATENIGYLPTTTTPTARPSSSSSTNYNPFVAQNKNHQPSNQYQTSSRPGNTGSDNYHSTTKKTGFERDYESGFKFNFAKTIAYSPSASASVTGTGSQAPAPAQYRSHYNGTAAKMLQQSTVFATTVRPDNVHVYHHNPIPTVVQTTTRKPAPSTTTYDMQTYAAKAVSHPMTIVRMTDYHPSTTSREVNNYSQDIRRSGEQVNYRNNEYQTRKSVASGQDDYYLYQQQQQQRQQQAAVESRGSNNYPHPPAKDKYSTTTVSNSFQGDKIVSKYGTKTSYNDGDDENYVELLRSLSRIGKDTATLAPIVQVHHRYDPEMSATIASPVAVHTWDFTATTTSTQRPIVYETTATTTSSPVFGKKIKSGRKRNTSNWQNYFFKSKSS